MMRAAVLVAAVVVLAGCGTDTPATTAQGSSSTSAVADKTSSSAGVPGDASSSSKGQAASDQPAKDVSTVPDDAPGCAAVWRDGTTLARDYEGCMAGARYVAVDQEPCSFGKQLVRFGDHFYAVRGGPVNHTAAPLAKDRTYRGAVASCRA
jgi:hypothetical protein